VSLKPTIRSDEATDLVFYVLRKEALKVWQTLEED